MIGGDLFFAVVLAGIIIAHFAAGMSFQASVGRLLYALGRDNQLPRKLFGALHPRYKTPAFNILLCGIFGCAGFALTIATATSLVNFGAFLAFSAVNLCALRLSFDTRLGDGAGLLRGVLCPLVGLVTAGWMLVSLDKEALIMGCSWLGLGRSISLAGPASSATRCPTRWRSDHPSIERSDNNHKAGFEPALQWRESICKPNF